MEYEYVGYTVDRRVVKGRITADNEKSAGDALLRDGYQILNVKPITPFLSGVPSFMKPKVKGEDVVMFSRQLALLLESGVGIVQSLDLLRAQSVNKNFSAMLGTVVTDLRSGLPLSVALEKHPGAFSKMFCKIIAVGEQTGQLESVLRNLASYSEQATTAMRKVKQATTYPAVVLVLAILVAILMVTFILPPILAVFKNLGGNLPLVTQILIGSIAFLTSYGIYIIVAIAIAAVVGYVYFRTPEGAYQRDAILLRLPVLGRLVLLNTLSRICRSITLLFRSGLPLPDILTLTADSAGNRVIARALNEVEQDIIKGEALASAMKNRPVFLPLMVEMTRVGEETGNLDSTLTVVSDSFEIEAADKLQTLLGLIEPAMTVAIGLVVGFLALSIFVPIYSAVSVVGGPGG
ncbi:MAG: type II secretion system F family protein [Dehalococcoidia bacterium]